eukprot:c14266_g1_i1.p1 GENE.c14266_g1_i1~~c14266_g1_i1.p1  ORF type:complete len:226 (+),score=32.10 c14266_g1_i1:32-679(+)
MHTIVPKGRSLSEPVVVNIYDLTPHNDHIYWAGFGFYHSGVVVYGKEYTFGGNGEAEHSDQTGVFSHTPKGLPNTVRDQVLIGHTSLTPSQVESIVSKLSSHFLARTYHLIHRNCNHFSDEFAHQLCGQGLPNYVNRVAYLARYVSCLFPQPQFLEPPPAKSEPDTPVFAGKGQTLSSQSSETQSTETDSLSAQARREMLLKAANRRSQVHTHSD